MALTTNIKVGVAALLTGSTDVAQTKSPHGWNFGRDLTSGTGNGQCDLVWGDTRQLAASANEDLDLSGTTLVGALGTVSFARVKGIFVSADAGNTNNVVVGGAAATQFVGPFGAATHTLAITPGNAIMLTNFTATGWAVTGGSNDLLRIANSGAGSVVNYTIMILGASA